MAGWFADWLAARFLDYDALSAILFSCGNEPNIWPVSYHHHIHRHHHHQ